MNDLEIKRSQYPRVSDILGKQIEAEMRKIPIDTLAYATLRGLKVHGYCLSYAAGLFLADIEPEYRLYVEAFIQWYDANVKNQIYNSVRLYDDINLFSGEFDLIVQMKSGEIALIDLKASCVPSKTWELQLAAYKHLCEIKGFVAEKVLNLHLKKKYGKKPADAPQGTPAPFTIQAKEIAYPDLKGAWKVFESALMCFDYFDRKGVK